MYILLIVLLCGVGGVLMARGARTRRPPMIAMGAAIAVLTVLFFAFMSFWSEVLWFDSVGFSRRLWAEVAARAASALAGAVFGWLFLAVAGWGIPKSSRTAARTLGVVAGAVWGFTGWETILVFLNRVSTGLTEPILGIDAGFYLFTLPLLDALLGLLLTLCLIALGAALLSGIVRTGSDEDPGAVVVISGVQEIPGLYTAAAAAFFTAAFGQVLAVFHLMYSNLGAVIGPGWTDTHVRLPLYWAIAAVSIAFGIILLIPSLRRRGGRLRVLRNSPPVALPAAAAFATATLWFLGALVTPMLFQWLKVQPSEITVERPYLVHNIEFTRRAFGLDTVEDRQFPAAAQLTKETLEDNSDLLGEVRLWDGRALDAVYRQFQEIRLYYEFNDVDIDRYRIGDRYRQVMISARDMNHSALPPDAQTFVNKRFQYTHGNGITLAPVREFTSEGLPNLLVKDIPPVSQAPELKVDRPELYYGELTSDPVIVNSQEPEFDYPSGDKNVYTRYEGTGGVQLTNLWRKFLYGWRFDGTRLLLSSYPTSDSRIMFHRNIADRVRTLAPFLTFDPDPYIVLVDGRQYWIVDGFTTSTYYPYSEAFRSRELIDQGEDGRMLYRDSVPFLNGVNYARNSVKAVVDAYSGAVHFYIFDPEDPIIQVWQRVFPGLFRAGSEMPSNLRAHVRYPHEYLLMQSLVYAKYHMTDPAVFYNREDLWIRATEKYYDAVQPVEPYYIMWKPSPGSAPEFSLVLPMTPKNRQVLIGWMAGLCDGENYGRLLSYKFPKESRWLGPQQVETKIDQDPVLSGQLTLWNQKGSRVIRGNVLAIPIDSTLIYVEPIYLQAETAAYPELRLVAVMHGDKLSYGPTFDDAIAGLVEGVPKPEAVESEEPPPTLISEARQAFESYLRLQSEKRFQEAGVQMETLHRTLRKLEERFPRLAPAPGSGLSRMMPPEESASPKVNR